MNEVELLTIIQASEFLNMKVSRMRYLVFRNSIPYFRIGRTIRFNKTDLVDWLNNQRGGHHA